MIFERDLAGKYKNFSLIGKGGFSEVYLATDKLNNTKVAIKIIRKNNQLKAPVFPVEREIEILRKLNHINIPKIHSFIDKNTHYILVMDYIEGSTISKCIQENRPWTEERVIDVATQLMNVLKYIHSQGYIFCDLKPSNIMIQPNGRIMLIDFGAVQSQSDPSHISLGTKGFAAPEQYTEKFDCRVDIYAFGITLFYMLTGMSPIEIDISSCNIREFNPTVSLAMANTIIKCTQKSPSKRYKSFDEIPLVNNTDGFENKFQLKHFFKIFGDFIRKKLKACFVHTNKQKSLYDKRKLEMCFSSIPQIPYWDETVVLTNGEYYKYVSDSILDRHQINIFLSYCHHDSDLADIICDKLDSYNFSISRYSNDVPYKGSFNEFMNTLGAHDRVIMIVSDMYLKSQACMYEVGQLINSPNFKNKILFIICSDDDKKYYRSVPEQSIKAKIYDQHDRNQYILFWEEKCEILNDDLKKIKNECAKIETLETLRNINNIISKDLGLFMKYLADANGISFTTLEQHDFKEFLNELGIEESRFSVD